MIPASRHLLSALLLSVALLLLVPQASKAEQQLTPPVPIVAGTEDITDEAPDGTELFGTPPTPRPTPSFPKVPQGFGVNFKMATSPKSGGRLAFTVKFNNYDRIFVLDLYSKRVSALIDGPGNNFYPSWSPDGTKLAFVSDRLGTNQIFVADWDGANTRQLSVHPRASGDPSWHPDGQRVVYFSEVSGKKHTNLWMTDINTGRSVQLTEFSGRNSTPRFSPDGKTVAYSTNRFWPGWDVCSWDIRAKRESCLLRGTTSFCRPAWSPNGKTLLFSVGGGKKIDIGEYSIELKRERPATSLPGRSYDAVYSPDGDEAAFASEDGHIGNFDLYLMDSGGETHPLLTSPFSMRYLSWSGRAALELEVERIKAREAQEKQRALQPPVPTTPEE